MEEILGRGGGRTAAAYVEDIVGWLDVEPLDYFGG